MGITRTTWTDDDGSGTLGSIVNNAELQKLYDAIDAQQAWVDITFAAGNFTAVGGGAWTVAAGQVSTNRYILLGKLLIWQFEIIGSTTTGVVTELRIALPTGTIAKASRTIIQVQDNNVNGDGIALVSAANNTVLRLFATVTAAVNWTASANEGASGVCLITLS